MIPEKILKGILFFLSVLISSAQRRQEAEVVLVRMPQGAARVPPDSDPGSELWLAGASPQSGLGFGYASRGGGGQTERPTRPRQFFCAARIPTRWRADMAIV